MDTQPHHPNHSSCHFHIEAPAESTCLDQQCDPTHLLCSRCIQFDHASHNLISIAKYKQIVSSNLFSQTQPLEWRWQIDQQNYQLQKEDKQMLASFKANMDESWKKVEEILGTCKSQKDLKDTRQVILRASETLSDFISKRLDSVLQRSRNQLKNNFVSISSSEQIGEKSENQDRSRQKKASRRQKRREQKMKKSRTEQSVKKANSSDKNKKQKKTEQKPQSVKKESAKQAPKAMNARKSAGSEGLAVKLKKKPSDEGVQYFSINNKATESIHTLPPLYLPDKLQFEGGQQEFEELKIKYLEKNTDGLPRIFNFRKLQNGSKEYLLFFSNQFQWVTYEKILNSDFEVEFNAFHKAMASRKLCEQMLRIPK